MKEIALRIHKLIAFYQLSSASFADQIGVQRSSISHILSGRNKPSLDFVLKTLKAFPTLSSDWLLHGHGEIEAADSIPASSIARKKENSQRNSNNYTRNDTNRNPLPNLI
jgi:transcriptional regulator with XRE-family HTH domain